MAQHALVAELLFAREASPDTRLFSEARSVRTDRTWAADGAEQFVDLVNPPTNTYGHAAMGSLGAGPLLDIQGTITTAGGTATVYAVAGQTFWQINGATASNGAAVFRVSPLASAGRLAVPFRVYLGGAALAAIVAIGAIQTAQFVIRYADRLSSPYTGEVLLGTFAEIPPNTTSNMAAFSAALLSEINTASAQRQIGITSAGAPVILRDCSYAALSPTLQAFIDPSDIGGANEQLPADVGSNTAARFAFHPSAFVRRSDYTRSVAVRTIDSVPIAQTNNLNQPVQIVSITTAPTASDWLMVIDGHMQIVRIPHPVGSDLRRPRDIWNSVIVPALQGGQGPGTPRVWDDPNNGTGMVALDRLRYLSYARCLFINGTNLPVLQTGTGGLG